MSLKKVSERGDEYYTPDYVVEILIPFLRKTDIKKIWCPADKDSSEYVKVLTKAGYEVIYTHIDEGKDILTYVPDEDYDAIITNPPFSIKNKVFDRVIELGKPFAILMSATSIQSASFVQALSKCRDIKFIIFDKRISYSGDRPPFPSWYFTYGILEKNEFYIYKENPKDLYKKWKNKKQNTKRKVGKYDNK